GDRARRGRRPAGGTVPGAVGWRLRGAGRGRGLPGAPRAQRPGALPRRVRAAGRTGGGLPAGRRPPVGPVDDPAREWPAALTSLPAIGAWVAERAGAAGAAPDAAQDLRLAVEEVVTNAITHGGATHLALQV